MQKRIFAVALLALFATLIPAVVIAQQNADPDAGFPRWWRSVSPAARSKYIQKSAVSLLEGLQGVKGSFEEAAGHYPFKGIGISLELSVKPGSTDDNQTVGVRVVGVWNDSPAATVLEPGDWILSVESKPTCGEGSFVNFSGKDSKEESASKNQLAESCLSGTLKMLKEASGEEVVVGVERDGEARTFKIGRALIGQKVKDFMSASMSDWEQVWLASEKEAGELLAELAAAGEDEAKIDGCFQKLRAIIDRAQGPVKQAQEFVKSQQRRMPDKE